MYSGSEDRIYHVNLLRQKAKGVEYKDITEKVIGCAYKVYNKMGFGFLESIYEKCLLLELHRAGLKIECQKALSVSWRCKSYETWQRRWNIEKYYPVPRPGGKRGLSCLVIVFFLRMAK